ncbi:MAG: carbonic anhydrase family protein [Actinomycetota bacterium]|nr:carbonic anhydrase family protein [Actinomycetota bacterium]
MRESGSGDEHGHGGEPPHWDYAGAEHWGELADEFATCGTGTEQSPIDLTRPVVTVIDDAVVDYVPSAATVTDNGHTVQVNFADGGTATVDGVEYELLQFHFHAPSEHTVDGEHSPVEGHLVHADQDGNLAVIGVMIVEEEPVAEEPTVEDPVADGVDVEDGVDEEADASEADVVEDETSSDGAVDVSSAAGTGADDPDVADESLADVEEEPVFDPDAASALIERVLVAVPEPGEEVALDEPVDATDLLPEYRMAYRYAGSLTTPPCSESVTWSVLVQPITWTAEQIATLESFFVEENNRPVQPLNERELLVDIVPD